MSSHTFASDVASANHGQSVDRAFTSMPNSPKTKRLLVLPAIPQPARCRKFSRVLWTTPTLLCPRSALPNLTAPPKRITFLDDGMRKTLGQALASEAAKSPRMQRVTFWTLARQAAGAGVNAAYPFAIEDFYPPLTP